MVRTVDEPTQYSSRIKWLITVLVSGAAAIDPLSGTIFYPALPRLPAHFYTSSSIANLAVALTNVSVAVCPLWWSAFSRTHGRRTALIASLTLCILFNALAARSSSIEMLITMRVLGSAAGSAGESVGAGITSEIWDTNVRGRAMGIFFLGPMLGVAIGPVIGGALVQKWSWPAVQWFLTIYTTALCTVTLFCLPETLKDGNVGISSPVNEPQAKPNPLRHIRRLSFALKDNILTPLSIIEYLRFPAIWITVLLASITFGISGFLTISLQRTFSSPPYSFRASSLGLTFVPLSLGLIVGSVLGGRWSDHIMAKRAKTKGLTDDAEVNQFQPEDRMRENAFLSLAVLSGGLLWYGWTAERGDDWIIPLISHFFIGAGIMTTYGIVTTMLTEFIPAKSASLVAVNSLGCNIVMTMSTVVAQPLVSRIGNGWLFTILACIIAANSTTIVVMKKFGQKWRDSMNRKLTSESVVGL